MNESYYIYDGPNMLGPYSIMQLREMYRAGTINSNTRICLEGTTSLQTISVIEHKFTEPKFDKQVKKGHPAVGWFVLIVSIAVTCYLVCVVTLRDTSEPISAGATISTPAVVDTPVPAGADNPASSQVTPPPTPDEVPVSELKWAAFRTVYGSASKMTDLQKDHYWPFWQGQRVRWSGTVEAISGNSKGVTLQVKMDPDTISSDLIIDLRPSEQVKALGLTKGSPVTFTATFVKWGYFLPTSMTDGVIDN